MTWDEQIKEKELIKKNEEVAGQKVDVTSEGPSVQYSLNIISPYSELESFLTVARKSRHKATVSFEGLSLEWDDIAMALSTPTRKVLDSNPGEGMAGLTFIVFASGKMHDSTEIRPRPLPLKSFSVHIHL